MVEGVSDLLYLQVVSALLESKGRERLSDKWTITPVGGADKVPTFVALLGAQKGLKTATLIDIQSKDKQTIENLYKRKLLKKQNVLTFADYTASPEADIEDMFGLDFYLRIVNAEYSSDLVQPITPAMLTSPTPRMLPKLEEVFRNSLATGGVSFNHYRPARYFVENTATLATDIPPDALNRFEAAFRDLNALL